MGNLEWMGHLAFGFVCYNFKKSLCGRSCIYDDKVSSRFLVV